MKIRELKTEDEWSAAFPIMQELRTALTATQFLKMRASLARDGYRLFATFDEKQIIALAGFAILTNLAYGKHIWVYDLVTAGAARSQGYGNHLLKFVEELAQRENCRCVALSSGLQRTDAHRFYEQRMAYDKTSYVFYKELV